MTRAAALLASFLIAAPALAQTETTPPTGAPAPAPTAAPATEAGTDIDRVRADFRARFVDYDERFKALERRIEALEKQLVDDGEQDADLTPTDSSAATTAPQGAPAGATPTPTPKAQ